MLLYVVTYRDSMLFLEDNTCCYINEDITWGFMRIIHTVTCTDYMLLHEYEACCYL